MTRKPRSASKTTAPPLRLAALIVAALASFGLADPALAETERSGGDNCVTLSQIRRSEILDNQTILFHMRNGHIRKATLAFTCPSLKFYGSFSYEVYSNRLCARFDTIVTRSGSHCPIAEIEDYEPPPDADEDKDKTDDD